jgi:NAD(P)-dependent dehydrogenase (short-subunit alcohol dehydrogenase family)
MGQFDGKTAVVTGGSTGIGLATAERLAAEGAHVFITGRREAELEKAVAAIGNATAVPGDVSVAADVDRLDERVRDRGQGVDVLFANAGVCAVQVDRAAAARCSVELAPPAGAGDRTPDRSTDDDRTYPRVDA